MDGYIFIKHVGDWARLYALQAEGALRSVAKIAAGPYEAIVTAVVSSPVQLARVKDLVCPQGVNNCFATISPDGGPCHLSPQRWTLLVEVRYDVADREAFFAESRRKGVGIATTIAGSRFNAFLEFTGHDYEQVEALSRAVLEHPSVRDYQISVTGDGLVVGAGPAGGEGGSAFRPAGARSEALEVVELEVVDIAETES